MPRRFDVRAEFNCDAATFVRDSLSAAYKQHQHARSGNPAPTVVLSDTRRDGWHITVCRNTPAADAPWPVRRLLRGRRIEYIETRRRRIGAERKLPLETHFESVCTLSDRVRVAGTVTISATGSRGERTEQRFRGSISVGVPTVGSLVEAIVMKHINRSYAEMPAQVDDWLKHREAAIKAQRRADVAAYAPDFALQAAAAAAREVQRLCAAAALTAATLTEPLLRLRQQPAL